MLQLVNVRTREHCNALGLITTTGRVRAVRIAEHSRAAEEELAADLVVDATGRGSKLPRWLAELGFEPPHEEHVEVGVGYTTLVCPREPSQAGGAQAVLVAPTSRLGSCWQNGAKGGMMIFAWSSCLTSTSTVSGSMHPWTRCGRHC